jgi:flagellar basal body-associated protein FliL
MSNINPKDDYATSKRDEPLRQQDNSGLQGILIGIFLVLGMGGIAAALFFFTRSETPAAPVIAPSSMPGSPPAIEKHETIIREKSTEVVPIPVAPAVKPNINAEPSAQPSASTTQPSSGASVPLPSSSPTEPALASPKP